MSDVLERMANYASERLNAAPFAKQTMMDSNGYRIDRAECGATAIGGRGINPKNLTILMMLLATMMGLLGLLIGYRWALQAHQTEWMYLIWMGSSDGKTADFSLKPNGDIELGPNYDRTREAKRLMELWRTMRNNGGDIPECRYASYWEGKREVPWPWPSLK